MTLEINVCISLMKLDLPIYPTPKYMKRNPRNAVHRDAHVRNKKCQKSGDISMPESLNAGPWNEMQAREPKKSSKPNEAQTKLRRTPKLPKRKEDDSKQRTPSGRRQRVRGDKPHQTSADHSHKT